MTAVKVENVKQITTHLKEGTGDKPQTKVGIHVKTGEKYNRKAYMKKYMAEYNKQKREAAKKAKKS